MKTKEEIEEIYAGGFDPYTSKYPSMNYEQGIDEALLWVLGEISDEEFSPICGG